MNRHNIKKIIVGYDFSDQALIAVEEALRIGRRTGAKVCLVHVGRWRDMQREMPTPNSAERFDLLLTHATPEARSGLLAVCKNFPEVHIEKLLVDSFPDTGIAVAAKEMAADLTVVGTHGHTGFKRFLLGSVAQNVVRIVETDVLVARPNDRESDDYKRILVPTDFSEASIRALETAIALAADDTVIDVVHFWYMPYISAPADWGAVPVSTGTDESLRNAARDAAVNHGAQLMSRFEGRHPNLSYAAFEDRPGPGIDRHLRDADYDLVVMGSHGRRGLRRLLLGSVAEVTVRHAMCSVLVTRASEEADAP